MSPEGARFMQEIHEVIQMCPEEKYYGLLRSLEGRPKRENSRAGIDRLLIYFDGKAYKSGGNIKQQESKYDIDSLMKVATDVMSTKISANAGINKFGDKAVAAMVKEYGNAYKGTMEVRTVITAIDPDTLSYEYKRKSLE